MADEKKISGLTEASDASASDEFVVVNKDVTSGADASASGQTSKITLDNLRNAILGGSSGPSGNDVIFDGNVGINETLPSEKLEVGGNIKARQLISDIGTGYNATFSKPSTHSPSIKFQGINSGIGLNWALGIDHVDGNSNKFHFQTIDDADGFKTQPLTIQSDGNVGIGTTSPHRGGVASGRALEIKDSAAAVLRLNRVNGQNEAVTDFSVYTGLQALDFYDNKNDVSRLVINNSGNVGIGTVSPSKSLDVHGKFTVNNDGVVNWGNLEGGVAGRLTWDSNRIIIRAGTGANEGSDGALPLSINASTLDMNASFFNMKNSGQYGATGLHVWNTSDGLPGAQGMIGAYTSYGTKTNNESTGPDYSYYTGIDMTEEGSPPNFKIGYANHDWAKPGSSNDLVVITSGGRVGIGTGFSPDPTQVVAGMLHLNNSHVDGNAELIFNYASNIFANTTRKQFGISYTDALHIGSVHNDAPLVAMTLNSNGCVGIGDTNPTGHSLVIDSNQNACIFAKVTGTGNYKKYFLRGFQGPTEVVQIGADETNNGEIILRNSSGVVTSSIVGGNIHSHILDADNLDNVRAFEASGLDSINNLAVSEFEKDGVTKRGIVAQDMQKVLPQSVSGGDEYEAVAVEAEGDVIRGLGTEDEHIYSTDIKKSDFENPEHTWDEGAEFIETKAEETETRNHSLATSNDELIATLVKAVQELSAKVDELSK